MSRKKQIRMHDQITTSEAYHWATQHLRHRIKPHYLDFKNYPVPVKSYDFIKTVDLIKDPSKLDVDLDRLFVQPDPPEIGSGLSLDTLSRILFLAYGVTRTEQAHGISFFYRTIPSAGGLYPCHLYLSVRGMDGLETGLYYCDMIQGVLGMIQKGNPSGQREKVLYISFFITGMFFNSAWKYRERAFRYLLLDAGHLAENLFLAGKAYGQPFAMDYDGDDEHLSRFLSIENSTEVPLARVHIRPEVQRSNNLIETGIELTGPRAEEKKSAVSPIFYPLLQKAYDLGKRVIQGDGAGSPSITAVPGPPQETICVSDFKKTSLQMNYKDAVLFRRSRRNFIPRELDEGTAFTLLDMAASLSRQQTTAADKVESYLTWGVSCQAVQGLEDGFYLFSKDRSSLLLMGSGPFQEELSRVCLDQKWISNAALNFLFMANLSGLEKGLGPRGYRYLFMHSGRIAQRIYLAATSLGLGCCGVGALYDGEAQCLFDLNTESVLFYAVSAGRINA